MYVAIVFFVEWGTYAGPWSFISAVYYPARYVHLANRQHSSDGIFHGRRSTAGLLTKAANQ